jgi:hypothetical protein
LRRGGVILATVAYPKFNIQNSKPHYQRIQNPKSKIHNSLAQRIQSPKPKMQNPPSAVNPKFKTTLPADPKSKIQNPLAASLSFAHQKWLNRVE